ncbi:MAG TPA: YEATS-associated helix-containing protein [Pyrinomonadaceae bacterium]|jgi:hypothetical protein
MSSDIPAQYILILIAIMLASGSLGGLVNYYLTRLENPSQLSLRESLVVGIAASFLVPLFLQMGSSNLLQEGVSKPLELFVFAGFCLIAAISSKAFIRTISEKILRDLRDAKNKSNAALVVATETRQEVEEIEEGIEGVTPQQETWHPVSDLEQAILRAVYSSRVHRPSFEDILALGHWQREELGSVLKGLEQRGLVRSKIYEDGQRRWRVRKAGKALIGGLQGLSTRFDESSTEVETG